MRYGSASVVVDKGSDDASADGGGAASTDEPHQAGGMECARHVAFHDEVFDCCSPDIAEGGGALGFNILDVDTERLPVAVEGALEGVLLRTYGGGNRRSAVVLCI